LVDTDQTAALEPLVKAAPADTDASVTMANALARAEVVKQCKKDLACYGGVLDSQLKEFDKLDASKAGKDEFEKAKIDVAKAQVSAKAEKAGFMLARGGRDALPILVKNVGYKDPAARMALMFALSRVANKGDKDVATALQTQIDVDRSKDKSAQALADEMRITAAIISR
jgi:hypothetical protein